MEATSLTTQQQMCRRGSELYCRPEPNYSQIINGHLIIILLFTAFVQIQLSSHVQCESVNNHIGACRGDNTDEVI